jgi:predicted Rossmann-fold nucleotide-binding protein
MRKPVVGVMGAGEGAQPEDLAHARKLGELIARRGWVLLTGGRSVSVVETPDDAIAAIKGRGLC